MKKKKEAITDKWKNKVDDAPRKKHWIPVYRRGGGNDRETFMDMFTLTKKSPVPI